MNESGLKIKDFIGRNLGYIAVFFTCAIYIATAIIQIDITGKTEIEIIADGFISFVLGYSINRICEFQGIHNGQSNELFKSTLTLHGNQVDKVSGHLELLSDWCEIENKKNYRIQRTKILSRVGLKYAECFDSDGVALVYTPLFENGDDILNPNRKQSLEKIEKSRFNAYKKAVGLHLTPITAHDLTSEGGRHSDPFYLGKTKAQYEKENAIKDFIIKFLISIVFGYFGVSLLTNFSWASLIWKALQVVVFLILGVINQYKAYYYILDEYRQRLIKKIDNLQKFENFINAHPDFAYYDEERKKELWSSTTNHSQNITKGQAHQEIQQDIRLMVEQM